MGPREELPPAQALRWYGRWIKYQWRRFDRAEVRVHDNIVRRHPFAAKIIEGLLGAIYDLIASPVFAVILALLLVGLVASETVTIIVSLAIFSAWLIFVITLARCLKTLPILRRFFAVIAFACIAAALCQLYVRWILVSYSTHHPEFGTSTHVAAATNPNPNLDVLLSDRIRELFADELGKFEKRNTKRATPAVPRVTEIHQTTNPSAKALMKITSDLTGNLRQFPYAWQDGVRQVELLRDEIFEYRTPPLTKKEDIDAANKMLADRLQEVNASHKRELSSLLQDADGLCRSLLEYIPKEKQTAEDKKKHEEIVRLIQGMWAWEDAYGCCVELNSLADYVDGLAKRVASGDA